MSTHRFAFKFAIIVFLSLTCSACLMNSGSGSRSTFAGKQGPLSITITSPDASQIDTTDESIRLQGTASSQAPVASVSWQSDGGASGSASGTASWQTDPIALDLGTNVITVRATDQDDHVATDTITINRESGEAGSATLSWAAPTERVDGTALTNLQGYRIYYGRMSGIYDYEVEITNPGIVTYMVENLVPGNWYFSIAAFDRTGAESEFSNEVRTKVL